MHSGLRSGMETACQCPPGSSVYRCPGKYRSGKLYEKFPDVDALAEAPVEEIEAIVKPCGLGHSKARDISACMKILRDKYDGKVPDDFDELLSLPGVGRKVRIWSWGMSLADLPL